METTWYRANTVCTADGGHLAVINSEEEAEILKNLAREKQKSDFLFVGFFNWFPEDGLDRGHWVTLDGKSLEDAGFASWRDTEPNNVGGQEYCGTLLVKQPKAWLNDLPCNWSIPFVCEIETPRVPGHTTQNPNTLDRSDQNAEPPKSTYVSILPYYQIDCRGGPFVPSKLPGPPRRVRVDSLQISNCQPPSRHTYTSLLHQLQITLGSELVLTNIPPSSVISHLTFKDLPKSVKTLKIYAFSLFVLQPRALAGLTNVRKLVTYYVVADMLPPYVEKVELHMTGSQFVPRGTLNAVNLTIGDVHAVTLAGYSRRLRTLHVAAPLYRLPDAPDLEVLSLINAFPEITKYGLSLLSNLRGLHSLDLSETDIASVCSDVLFQMKELATLNLARNRITTFQCSILKVQRVSKTAGSPAPIVDLTGNAITRSDCTAQDYKFSLSGPHSTVTTKIELDSVLKCDCGAYWTSHILAGSRSVQYPERYEGDCSEEWRVCDRDSSPQTADWY